MNETECPKHGGYGCQCDRAQESSEKFFEEKAKANKKLDNSKK